MSQYPDGSYHLYTTEKVTHPLVVELMCDYVAICGEEGWRPLAQCPGRLVRLQEVREVEPTHQSADTVSDVASGLAMALLQETLDKGGSITIPSLNITIGPDEVREVEAHEPDEQPIASSENL